MVRSGSKAKATLRKERPKIYWAFSANPSLPWHKQFERNRLWEKAINEADEEKSLAALMGSDARRRKRRRRKRVSGGLLLLPLLNANRFDKTLVCRCLRSY